MSAAPPEPPKKVNGAMTPNSVRQRLKATRMAHTALTEEELEQRAESTRMGLDLNGPDEEVTLEQVRAALAARRKKAQDTGRSKQPPSA